MLPAGERIPARGGQALLQTNHAQWPRYTLQASATWLLGTDPVRSFDASALLLLTNGDLLTLNDRGPTPYRIDFLPNTNVAALIPLTDIFSGFQLRPYARDKFGYYDSEGLARDEIGRIYLCEEANRWVLRYDPQKRQVERLDIDWSPVKRYFSTDRNASFEGIAVGGEKLFVANERSTAVIIVVDLKTLNVVDHFQVFPQKMSLLGTHYSDLCWHAGHLWVLCRQHSVVLEVEPESHQVLTEFDYGDAENQLGYQKALPVGVMEGLAVTDDVFWLCTDNNGFSRLSATNDHRPTLLKCPRPDRKKSKG